MTSFSTNLERLMNQKDMNDSDLADLVDVNRTTVTRWRKGIRSPKLDKLPEIANVFGVEPLDLINDSTINDTLSEIDKISSQLTLSRQNNVLEFANNQLDIQNNSKDTVIDLDTYRNDNTSETAVNGYVSAGTGEQIFDEPIFTVNVKGYIPPHDIALQVNGNSMEPMFNDKEIIFVDKSNNIKNGQIGVFIINGEAYVKKVHVGEDRLTLVSLNKDYPDLHFYENEGVELVGKVIL
ncbi:helix-turn-helix transcriptional regulator [Staphylococcus lugdunensis]|jgi:phage repressor protein C with HTH and peptisase S24 domain|uniref:helix-turn-helix domain-containing protein n=1 Tax=Staphylococcus TaxID=1279 RepID=UPI00165B0019|nr:MULTISPECIES: XRE family transcriptional regulator [Staphylococcus]MCI2771276.1 XRE family transcriptional regulator [Staphylococcus warneri]MCI2783026.1 XRE family transcriptional regulator [Staphylococcus warneri]QNQ45175.1 helix-turn-helix transcriptional regulator [Staphylococcus warneri]QRF15910.1 helix-turn-helix transcriptional regulator [Staphylococcus lugdunensis]